MVAPEMQCKRVEQALNVTFAFEMVQMVEKVEKFAMVGILFASASVHSLEMSLRSRSSA